jgi:hypothetical protein
MRGIKVKIVIARRVIFLYDLQDVMDLQSLRMTRFLSGHDVFVLTVDREGVKNEDSHRSCAKVSASSHGELFVCEGFTFWAAFR